MIYVQLRFLFKRQDLYVQFLQNIFILMTHQNLASPKLTLSLTLKVFSLYILSLSEWILHRRQIFHDANET